MRPRSALARFVSATALALGGFPIGAASPAAAVAPSVDAFVLVDGGTSLGTLTLSFAAVSDVRPIGGLQPAETLHGIDVRPTTGQLFALGSTSRLYVINPSDAAATAVGAPFVPALSGSGFGFDFDPVADRIRVTSNTGQTSGSTP